MKKAIEIFILLKIHQLKLCKPLHRDINGAWSISWRTHCPLLDKVLNIKSVREELKLNGN